MKEHKPESVLPLIQVDPLEVEIGYSLIPLVDPEQGGTLLERITNIRRRSALEWGSMVPPIRIRDNMELEPETYSILIKGVEVGAASSRSGSSWPWTRASDGEDRRRRVIEPVFGLKAIWIEPDVRDKAESSGYTVVDCPTIIATHLTEIIKRHADEILGRQEVQQLIDNMKNDYPAVVEEVITEKKMSLGEIQKVLQNLLRERVSIRNMVTILETLASYVGIHQGHRSPHRVRAARACAADLQGLCRRGQHPSVITVDPEIENIIRPSIHDDPVEGRVAGPRPGYPQPDHEVPDRCVRARQRTGFSPVYLVSPQIRSVTFSLLEREIPDPIVLHITRSRRNQGQRSASALMSNAA